jgi:nitroreductase
LDILEVIKKRRFRAYTDEKVSEEYIERLVEAVRRVSSAGNTPKNLKPVAIIPVGYPAQKIVAPHRRPVSEIVHIETF